VALARVQEQQAPERAVEVPRAAVGEVVLEGDRVELLGDPDVGHARVGGVAQREVDEPVGPGERDRGLGALLRQELEAPAASG